MILEFDLGNTRCKWRVRDTQAAIVRGHLFTAGHFSELDTSLSLYRSEIKSVWCVSVVSETKEQELVDWCKSFLNITPRFARAVKACAGVISGYAEPSKLGADRWLGIVSAHNYFPGPLMLVSFGTAVTVDLVSMNGRHLGGFIAPGINLMLDSLASRTSRIAIDNFFEVTSLQVGITTNEAVYAALTVMLVGLIDSGAAQLHKMEIENNINVVFTGGDAGKFLSLYPEAKLMPDLVLDGLDYVFNDPKNAER